MKTKKIFTISIVMAIVFSCSYHFAIGNSYGTTTYFSQKDEMPSSAPPILDNKDHSKGNNDSNPGPGDSLINGISNGLNSLLGDQSAGNENQGNSGSFDAESIRNSFMGARGESPEYAASAEEGQNGEYSSNIARKFNFNSQGSNSTPKKSKLLFTNIIIPMDLTTQYVLIILIFLVAIGLAVGYYWWKKEEAEDKKYHKKDND